MSVQMGIGRSSETNVYQAGQAAARQMLDHLGGPAQLTLVFASIRFADPKLLEGIRQVTEGSPLIGCTDAGGISTWGPRQYAVTVIGLRGEGLNITVGLANGISRNPEIAGARLAKELCKTNPQKIRAALMFPDGLATNGSALLRNLQMGLSETIPIVGGSAGDDFYYQRTFQFYNDDILTDSVPGALLCGEIEVGIGVRHGWVPLGRPRCITRSRGDVIYQLDGHPAVTLYEKYLGTKRKSMMQRPLSHFAGIYPLGIHSEENEEYTLRSAIRIGEQGSLVCSGECPEGSWVRLMIGGYESALSAARDAAHSAVRAMGQSVLKGALVFSSIERQKMLGSESQGEIDVIRDSLGGIGVRLAGFYGYGEQAPLETRNTFHNGSVVVMALA